MTASIFREQPAALEDRLRERERERPDGRRAGEEIAERRAFAAEEAGQYDAREERRARLGDACVGGDQALLRFDDVGAAQQQVGRQSLGYDGRLRLALLGATLNGALRDGARAAAREHRERELLRGPVRLQRGQLGSAPRQPLLRAAAG